MGDIALRGNKLTAAKGGRARLWHGGPHNTGRTNLLEQLGRVEGERSNPNRRAEISRVHGELNRGYAKGGRAGFAHGMSAIKRVVKRLQERKKKKRLSTEERELRPTGLGAAKGGRIKAQSGKFITKKDKEKTEWITKKPKYITRKEEPKYITRKEKPKAWITKKDFKTHGRDIPTVAAKGGRIEFRKGGTDKKWMQKVSASIKKRKTKGKCTPITKPGCTGRAKALAKTFKKIAAKRKA